MNILLVYLDMHCVCILYLYIDVLVYQAGIYWEELMGYYSAGWSLILIALAEICIVAYVYGKYMLTYTFIGLTLTEY